MNTTVSSPDEIPEAMLTALRSLALEEIEHVLRGLGVHYDPAPVTDEFNPKATGWAPDDAGSVQNTICMLRAALLAYKNPAAIRAEARRCVGIKAWKFFEDSATHTQGFGLVLPDATIIAFRGTETRDLASQLRDLYLDALVRKVSFNGHGRVHRGFLAGLDGVWPAVCQLINATRAPNRIWFTGHSLGGALATLAAAKVAFQSDLGPDRIGGLVTIGQPRTGDRAFRDSLRKVGLKGARSGGRIVRMAKARDPISLLPPEAIGYKHIDGFVYVTAAGQLRPQAESERRLKLALLVGGNALKAVVASLTGLRFSFGSFIEDHDGTQYLSALRDHREELRCLEETDDLLL